MRWESAFRVFFGVGICQKVWIKKTSRFANARKPSRERPNLSLSLPKALAKREQRGSCSRAEFELRGHVARADVCEEREEPLRQHEVERRAQLVHEHCDGVARTLPCVTAPRGLEARLCLCCPVVAF